MILAAGLGTRLRPLTDTKPKALVDIGGHTMLELSIRFLKKYGIRDIVINVHHFADQIISYLESNKGFGLNYSISDERDMLLDTGGAIVKASKLLRGDEPFILMGTDILTNLDLNAMIRYHLTRKPLVTLAVKDRITSRSLLFNKSMQLIGWRDNSSGSIRGKIDEKSGFALGFSVIQIIDPSIFDLIEEKGAFSIIDLYLRLMENYNIIGFCHNDSIWLEFGRADKLESTIQSSEYQTIISQL